MITAGLALVWFGMSLLWLADDETDDEPVSVVFVDEGS